LVCRTKSGGGTGFLPRILQIGGGITALASVSVFGQTETPTPESVRSLADQLLAFIYSLGHLIGEGIVRLLNTILPAVSIPTELIDPIGLLAILTIFLAVAMVAKKLAWIVVIVGWALILIRIIIIIVQSYL
jgi:hypothetical protein